MSCLSAMGDQLSQWRGYAEGGGYAIHYDAKPLRSSIRLYGLDGPNRFGERNALDQIAYETEDAGRYVEEILARLIPAICEQFHLDPDSGRDALAFSYEFALIELEDALGKMKNPAFKEEQEFRIMARLPEKSWDSQNSFHDTSGVGSSRE